MNKSITTAQPLLNSEIVLDRYSIMPSNAEEQTTIATYLDRKTAEIDHLIADKKRLLELYEEEKTAIINQAVTKGIDRDVAMKESGIEWVGEVPEGWEVKKLKWLHKTTSGGTPKTSDSEYYNGNIPWIRTLDLNNGNVIDCEIRITEKALLDSSARIVPVNSVLVAMYGGAGTIGKSGLLKFEPAINQAVCAILPNEKRYQNFCTFLLSTTDLIGWLVQRVHEKTQILVKMILKIEILFFPQSKNNIASSAISKPKAPA